MQPHAPIAASALHAKNNVHDALHFTEPLRVQVARQGDPDRLHVRVRVAVAEPAGDERGDDAGRPADRDADPCSEPGLMIRVLPTFRSSPSSSCPHSR